MKFKVKPEDFVVKEICNLDYKDRGEYGYFVLWKRNYTTQRAIEKIAQILNVNARNINYSGLKDKISISEQYISVNGYKQGKFKWKKNDLGVWFLGYGNKRINLGDSKFNAFLIVVRELSKKNKIECNYLENYFDEQRLGVGNENVIVGKKLLKRDFKGICDMLNIQVINGDYVGALRRFDKRILRIYLHAYQSFLFNEVLKEYIKLNFKDYKQKEGFLFLDLKEKIDLKIPLFNFDTEFKDKNIEEIYLTILKREGMDKKEFLIREMPELINLGVERDGFVKVEKISYKYDFDDMNKGKLKCVLSFRLPAGSYATILLKKIF